MPLSTRGRDASVKAVARKVNGHGGPDALHGAAFLHFLYLFAELTNPQSGMNSCRLKIARLREPAMPPHPDRSHIEAATEWRRHLHSIPELGFGEHKTQAFVAEKLRDFGLEVHQGIGGTGVVGVLRRGPGNHAIALRADMDALKIMENTGLPYALTHQGQMHACGHDGHMAMLLGSARHLSEHGRFSGTVYFIFQPNEEHGRGARAMIADGLFDRFPFEEIYGVHNMPGMPVGAFATRPGPLMGVGRQFRDPHPRQGRSCGAPACRQ